MVYQEGTNYDEILTPTTKKELPFIFFYVSSVWVESSSNGNEDCIPEWWFERKCIHDITISICNEGLRT